MIGERIKETRKALKLTQQTFADRVGLKQNSIALLESDKRNPSDQLILSICREFRVNETWLRTGEGEMFAPTPTSLVDKLCEEYGLGRTAHVMLETFVTLPEEARAVIADYIERTAAELNAAPPAGSDAERDALHAELDRQLDMEKERGGRSAG